jgi:hypothetical protein
MACCWRGITVEAEDKSPGYLQAGLLDALDRCQQVAVFVLHLAALGVAVLVSRQKKSAPHLENTS